MQHLEKKKKVNMISANHYVLILKIAKNPSIILLLNRYIMIIRFCMYVFIQYLHHERMR